METTTFEKGNITVHTENIFPIIKKSLYSDHEIFLRELISNAVDATQKLKYVVSGEDTTDTTIRISFDKEKKTITISDHGIGMTLDEVKKYINQVAFSGAEEFVKKFTEAKDANAIIGRFGLGFYSAFMVADSVEILTKSYIENAEAVHWTCDGSTEYTIGPGEKAERGTDIILHVSPDSEEFLDKFRLNTILERYCKFLPAKVEFEGEVISNHDAIWKKAPAELTDEDYQQLHRTLYPMSEDPLFWIHLNVDFPFTLNGILFFPKQKAEMEALRKDRINLYSRGVFITDKVEDIVPEYLLLLQGVIESPDIPLNVSRSFLQATPA